MSHISTDTIPGVDYIDFTQVLSVKQYSEVEYEEGGTCWKRISASCGIGKMHKIRS